MGTDTLRILSAGESRDGGEIRFLSPLLLQGLFKFGLYEVFKVKYAEMLGEENSYLYRTGLYLAASASAEFFADIGELEVEEIPRISRLTFKLLQPSHRSRPPRSRSRRLQASLTP
jgi:hypothetical protein